MAYLYFKNTTATGAWNDATNWFTDAACTTQATNVPWVSGDATYLGYDLTRSADSVTAEDQIIIDAAIGDGLTITGTCDIATVGFGNLVNTAGNSIYGGTWSGDFFSNGGYIYGGAFSGSSFVNESSGLINGGNFTGDSFTNQAGGGIYGGKFSGSFFSNLGSTYGGLFDTATGLTGPIIDAGGVLFDFTLLTDALFLGGVSWDAGPWYEDYECTVPWTGDVPWTTSATQDKHILRGNAAEYWAALGSISIDTPIGDGLTVTGTCYLDGTSEFILNNSDIHAGTFVGNYFYNSNFGNIYAGTFSGVNFVNSFGTILGGTFSGDDFYNEYNIYGGTFSGDYFYNNHAAAVIYGGTFSGDYFTNANSSNIFSGTFSGNSFVSDATIWGGVFSGDSFSNSNGTIYGGIFSGFGFTNSAFIYNGVFSGDNFSSGGTIYGGIFSGESYSGSGSETVAGGFWLESGSLDVDIFEYAAGSPSPTVTGQIRIKGTVANPLPLDLATSEGFMTLKIKGQDVLGAGLL